MKRFFTKNGILLLAAVTIVAVILCVVSAVSSGTGFLYNAAGVIASPFRAAGAAVSGWVEDIGGYFRSVEGLQRENELLRQENARLQEAIRQAETDSEENARLRSLLELRRQRRELSFESAYITGRSVSNWASTLTLGKGTSSDVAIGDCVVDEYGYLVGVITDAGLNWSTVTTVLDTDSQLGATVFRTGETLIASGDLHLMNSNRLRANFLEGDLTEGDLIVTSGLGGYYPSDLVIGAVEEIKPDDSGLGRYAVLAPKADLDALSEVFVITDFDIVE
ncbi:MAG: rod shape-determining protein MreC [Ruminococcaceae bacterium]|jgi:rod shape-determining protein MreC|nr:rod shape-determining protein MreC [Oscillospiraceae bacterium]